MRTPSVVWNESSEALPRRIIDRRGGRSAGQRNIQYSPENGIPNGPGRGAPSLSGAAGTGTNSVVNGFNSGRRITPGKSPPNAVLSGGARGSLTAAAADWPPSPGDPEAASD